jgi:hypothetical protein
MNERRTYGTADKTLPKGALLMISDNVYPEPRPIYELLMQISHYTPADYDSKILAGAALNDDDDTASTLESLKSAEAISGNKMTTPIVDANNFEKSGSEVEDFLARSHKVSSKELEDALSDKIPFNNNAAQLEIAEKQKKAAEAAALVQKNIEAAKAATKEMSIHFQADDIMDAEEVQVSESSSEDDE